MSGHVFVYIVSQKYIAFPRNMLGLDMSSFSRTAIIYCSSKGSVPHVTLLMVIGNKLLQFSFMKIFVLYGRAKIFYNLKKQ